VGCQNAGQEWWLKEKGLVWENVGREAGHFETVANDQRAHDSRELGLRIGGTPGHKKREMGCQSDRKNWRITEF